MTKRMLIDDTQPEETRVVVINGNKLEDVEFESSSRKQIKGNIYMAKVMRIEPSLQAAFVDYGGNRHGFLAFGEIHPDYYHVDEKTLAALEQEVNDIIENKKQAARERELERARLRQERALKRAQRLEQEAAKAAAAAAENTAGESAENNDRAEAEENPNTDSAVEVENNVAAPETATESVDTTETAAAENKPEENGEEKARQARGRRGRKTKDGAAQPARRRGRRTKNQEETTAPATAEEGQPIAENATGDTSAENIENIDDTPAAEEKFKTLSEAAGITEEKITEDERADEADEEIRSVGSAADEEVAADDDDDDSEYDYEMQKKLLLMRKLFHQSKIQDVIKEGQILLVQVVKEERGNKGAALTTYLSLAGRYCVLMPNRIKSGGVSRACPGAAGGHRGSAELPEARAFGAVCQRRPGGGGPGVDLHVHLRRTALLYLRGYPPIRGLHF